MWTTSCQTFSWFELVKALQPCIAHFTICNCYTSMSSLAFSSLNLCEACQHLFVHGLIYSLDTKINLLYVSDLLSSTQISGVVMWAAWIVFSVVVLLSAPPWELASFPPYAHMCSSFLTVQLKSHKDTVKTLLPWAQTCADSEALPWVLQYMHCGKLQGTLKKCKRERNVKWSLQRGWRGA